MSEVTQQSPRKSRTGDLIHLPPDPRDAAPAGQSRKKAAPHKPAGWLAYLALILLTIGSYAPIFNSGLIWSEYDQVERSPYQSMETWTEAWAPDMIHGEDPITLSSYFLERVLPLPPAIAHHAINLLLHVFAALLLLKALDTLKLPAAFSATLVFALHPAVLQTIFWSGFRSELFGLILLLAALFFGLRNRDARDFSLLIVISVAAYWLHPASLMLPLVLGLCIFYQKGNFHLKDYNRLLPLLCLALFIGVWAHAKQTGQEFNFGEQLNLHAQNLFFYLKQVLWPVELALFHPLKQSAGFSVGAKNSLLPFLLFVPFYILIAVNFRKSWARGLLLGLTGYLLLSIYGLGAAGAFLDGSPAQENHSHYIALPVLVALAVCSFGAIAQKMGTSGRVLWYLGFTVFAVIQFAITATYAYTVSDREQMWYHMSEQWPESWLPKLALIHTIQENGGESDLLTQSETIKMLESMLEQQPQLNQERQLLARIYRKEGQNSNALRHYKRILRESKPGNDFLREAADFYEMLSLNWDANNARERITE